MNKINGLSSEEVLIRVKNNEVNTSKLLPTKSYKQIILSNIFTLFNIINLFLGILIILTGEFKNLTFLGVAFINTFISMFQEVRAKYTIDKLALLSTTKVTCIRDGKEKLIEVNEIVKDDILKYKLGNQVVVDSVILNGSVEVDESFLTGESDYILKHENDKLLSGSFIVSGDVIAKVTSVGSECYANKMVSDAKYMKEVSSEIMTTLNKVIKFISVIIIPLGILLFLKHSVDNSIKDAIISTVAALIGTIPEGLVLLTSTVLAVSSIRLTRKNVLIEQLYCIESLARVDTICLDKTGTLTTGNMKINKLISLDKNYDIDSIMNDISYNMKKDNNTSIAIKDYFKDSERKCLASIPFSSLTKTSVYEFEDNTYIIGAPEFIKLTKNVDLDEYTMYRVLLIGVNKNKIKDNHIDGDFKPIGLLLIEDELRNNAKETIEYLIHEDVDIKIISGDNVKTVSNIMKKLNFNNIKALDMSNFDGNLDDVIDEYNVFGRVTPIKKKEIVLALQKRNHKVAMTGDGVNDVLALKASDCSITVSKASSAARNVSEIVLLDSDFKAIPDIIKEGRRTINNLERSASLFLTKTIYATILAILFLFIKSEYPFIPIQLTLISVLTIGIPSFVLALEPNHNRVSGKFIIKVIRRSIPAALTIVSDILIIIFLGNVLNFSQDYISTMSVILVAFTGFVLLFKICYPFNYLRLTLYITLITSFLVGSIGLNKLFELVIMRPQHLIYIGLLCLFDICLFKLLTNICEKNILKYEKRI